MNRFRLVCLLPRDVAYVTICSARMRATTSRQCLIVQRLAGPELLVWVHCTQHGQAEAAAATGAGRLTCHTWDGVHIRLGDVLDDNGDTVFPDEHLHQTSATGPQQAGRRIAFLSSDVEMNRRLSSMKVTEFTCESLSSAVRHVSGPLQGARRRSV